MVNRFNPLDLREDGANEEATCVVVSPTEVVVFGDGFPWSNGTDSGPLGPSKGRSFEETLAGPRCSWCLFHTAVS